MATSGGTRHAHDPLTLLPKVAERVELETTPQKETVSGFVMTRAAERSWQNVNRHLLSDKGALFWIGGPAGCGKTHFLNYILALADKAPVAAAGRRLVCGIELAGRMLRAEIEAAVLGTIAEKIGAPRDQSSLWLEVGGAQALTLAMEHARRVGIRACILAIDFSASEAEIPADFLRAAGEFAAKNSIVRLDTFIASRLAAPLPATNLTVAPESAHETASVAIQRSRILHDSTQAADLYAGLDLGGFEPAEIFPFHPLTAKFIAELAGPCATIAQAAHLAREAIAAALDEAHLRRLIYPADLMDSVVIASMIEARLGNSARAALLAAEAAIVPLERNQRQLGREIIATIAVERALIGAAPIALAALRARLPILAAHDSDASWSDPALLEMLERLEKRSQGVVRVAADGAVSFEPQAAGAPEIARYNSALALAMRFDPSLPRAESGASLTAGSAALAEALALAVEEAHRVESVLRAALGEASLAMPPEQSKVLADYARLAEGGPALLIETAIDPERRSAAAAVINAYEKLAAAAEVAPRMRAMREFARDTALKIPGDDDFARDPKIAALQTECHLLLAELAPRTLADAPRGLDALEARFQKFKWTYAQLYSAAHSEWRSEMERLAIVAEDVRRRFDALVRLNAIATLGPAAGSEFGSRLDEVARAVVRCDREGALHPEVTPRCACGYRLGTPSPRVALQDLLAQIDRALHLKLEALSRSAIARIIREHDRAHRLEGLLKIIQASQTDALSRVLDDRLARYLARLLNENLAPANADESGLKLGGTGSSGRNPRRREASR